MRYVPAMVASWIPHILTYLKLQETGIKAVCIPTESLGSG